MNLPNKYTPAAAADHVLYEIIMLIESYDRMKIAFNNGDALGRNGWLEAFAIHARNLNEFFSRTRPTPKAQTGKLGKKAQRELTDIYPNDIIPGWTSTFKGSAELKRRADKQVAHLTYDRERPTEKSNWPTGEFLPPIMAEARRFVEECATQPEIMSYFENGQRITDLLYRLPKY